MNAARLDTIYSLLLAHCFSLSREDLKVIDKHWQCAIYGDRDIRWPSVTLADIREAIPNAGALPSSELHRKIAMLPFDHPLKVRASIGHRDPAPVKICSMPSELEQLSAVHSLSAFFDLEGVPGFYRERFLPGPGRNDLRAQMIADFGPWRLNLPKNMPKGLLTPYDAGSGFIVGLRIHRNVHDKQPFLLSSKNLPDGARAVADRSVAA